MAVDSRDPITGAYIFSDTGAPDIGVDPTLVSAQANDVGTRIIRANFAALDSYAYKRPGLRGITVDNGWEYVCVGTAWKLAATGDFLIQRIAFTAASSVVFTGFSSLFDHYFAILDINSTSAASGGTFRMRSGATDASAALYTTQQEWVDGTGFSAARPVNQTSIPAVPIAGSEHTMKLDFFGPFLARPTRMAIEAQTWVTPTDGKKSSHTARHNSATSFDGFSFTPSTGNVTGTLAVYGRI